MPVEAAGDKQAAAPRKSASPKARVNAPMEVKLLAIEAWEAGLKQLAQTILPELSSDPATITSGATHESSTTGLINHFKTLR